VRESSHSERGGGKAAIGRLGRSERYKDFQSILRHGVTLNETAITESGFYLVIGNALNCPELSIAWIPLSDLLPCSSPPIQNQVHTAWIWYVFY
jgi:hypothetical protein